MKTYKGTLQNDFLGYKAGAMVIFTDTPVFGLIMDNDDKFWGHYITTTKGAIWNIKEMTGVNPDMINAIITLTAQKLLNLPANFDFVNMVIAKC